MEKQSKIQELKKAFDQVFSLIQEMQKEQFENKWNRLVEKQNKKEEIAVFSDSNREVVLIKSDLDGKNTENHSVRFSITDVNEFKEGCFIDKNIFKSFIESDRKAEVFKEYSDMWISFKSKHNFSVDWENIFSNYKKIKQSTEKQNKLNRLNKKLEYLDSEREAILQMKELTERNLI